MGFGFARKMFGLGWCVQRGGGNLAWWGMNPRGFAEGLVRRRGVCGTFKGDRPEGVADGRMGWCQTGEPGGVGG